MEAKMKAIVNQSFEYIAPITKLEKIDVVMNATHMHMVHHTVSNTIEILDRDFYKKTYTLKINGNRYTVQIEDEIDFLIEAMGLSLGVDSFEHMIHAPMPGLILEVNVKEGQVIKTNDALCVLEAMKMENSLLAPSDGIVKSVKVNKGDTVEKGVLLIEMEKE